MKIILQINLEIYCLADEGTGCSLHSPEKKTLWEKQLLDPKRFVSQH